MTSQQSVIIVVMNTKTKAIARRGRPSESRVNKRIHHLFFISVENEEITSC